MSPNMTQMVTKYNRSNRDAQPRTWSGLYRRLNATERNLSKLNTASPIVLADAAPSAPLAPAALPTVLADAAPPARLARVYAPPWAAKTPSTNTYGATAALNHHGHDDAMIGRLAMLARA